VNCNLCEEIAKHIANLVGVGLGRPLLELNVLFLGGASPAPTMFEIDSITQTTIFLQNPCKMLLIIVK
jgi:hypothetical protein